jgi:hypothetical protein
MVYGGTRTWSSSVLESKVSLINFIKEEGSFVHMDTTKTLFHVKST